MESVLPPLNVIAIIISIHINGYSYPPLTHKNPFWKCTTKVATNKTPTNCAEKIRVNKPSATQIPPTNSIIPTYHAKKTDGSIEIDEKNFAVLSIPPSLNNFQ